MLAVRENLNDAKSGRALVVRINPDSRSENQLSLLEGTLSFKQDSVRRTKCLGLAMDLESKRLFPEADASVRILTKGFTDY